MELFWFGLVQSMPKTGFDLCFLLLSCVGWSFCLSMLPVFHDVGKNGLKENSSASPPPPKKNPKTFKIKNKNTSTKDVGTQTGSVRGYSLILTLEDGKKINTDSLMSKLHRLGVV